MKTKAIALLVLIGLASCQNPRLNYVMAEKNYKAAVDFAVAQRKAGNMTDATYHRLDPAIQAGNKALENWLDMILKTPEGEKPDIPATVYKIVLDTLDILEAYLLQEQR
ncbi:MAG: hypothetical protein ACYTFZ_02940 [Planctomycetota bacterium]|jgi:hypothetical protein